jgi:DNA-binding beta-propeller fold protein YncE
MQIPLIGKQTQGVYPINLYYQPERKDQRAALIGTPGLKLFVDPGNTAPVRNMWVFNGNLYAVCGNTVYKITPAGASTALATTLNTSSGYVCMADNGTQIMITDGAYGYLIVADVLTQIADLDFPVPDWLTYQDTYFIIIEKDTQKFYISGNNDGTTWDALDFASAEGTPDSALAIISDHRELWILGEKSTEIFYNSGDVDFPFERIQGAYLERGIGAPASIAKLDNSVFWLTEQFQIVRAQEYSPGIISTRQIDLEIEKYPVKSDAVGYAYTQAGHSFYVLNFPTANKTWVFDAATETWHQRSSQPVDGRHRGNCYAYFNGKHLVGDFDNGKIYELNMETYDDDGEVQKAVHVFPPVEVERKNVFHNRIEIECSTGVGLPTGQGSDPVAILDWTNDHYKTWSNEHWLPLGQIGEYTARVYETRLGSDRWRAYRLTITDPVERVIVSPYLDAKLGR